MFRIMGCLLLVAGLSMGLAAQVSVTGKVTGEGGQPLSAASVFLASTSYGTVANEAGVFVLSGMQADRYDLIISYSGYQTYSVSIDLRITMQLELPPIKLVPSPQELDNVVVRGYEKSGWATWGNFFLENFIGAMPEAKNCRLLNPDDVEFRHYRSQDLLMVNAKKPLIINNNTLGYTISYQLESFEYDFKSKILYFTGYPLFTPKFTNNQKLQARWDAARAKAYYGSKLHFMRALYRNTLTKEGFEVRRMQKVPNVQKEQAKVYLRKQLNGFNAKAGSVGPDILNSELDSSAYYRPFLRQPDVLDILNDRVLPGDSVAYAINETTIGFYFKDYLHITYIKKEEDKAYLKYLGLTRFPQWQVSTLTLPQGQAVEVGASGAYFNPLNLLEYGYWSWSGKMATELPFDYKPPVIKLPAPEEEPEPAAAPKKKGTRL